MLAQILADEKLSTRHAIFFNAQHAAREIIRRWILTNYKSCWVQWVHNAGLRKVGGRGWGLHQAWLCTFDGSGLRAVTTELCTCIMRRSVVQRLSSPGRASLVRRASDRAIPLSPVPLPSWHAPSRAALDWVALPEPGSLSS